MAYAMNEKRTVRFFRNGRNQAVRIPREFEMAARTGTIEKQGDRLIIEPARRGKKRETLAELFDRWAAEPTAEEFPNIPDLPLDPPPDLG
jgi:antitoxin VapB